MVEKCWPFISGLMVWLRYYPNSSAQEGLMLLSNPHLGRGRACLLYSSLNFINGSLFSIPSANLSRLKYVRD